MEKTLRILMNNKNSCIFPLDRKSQLQHGEKRTHGSKWQSTCITANIGKTKARDNSSFLVPWNTADPLKSSSFPLYFIVVLKMNSKTQERGKALTNKKRKKRGCYGSVSAELLKFGAYLYFKTNRDHVNNSRCCKGRIEFIIGRFTWGQKQ